MGVKRLAERQSERLAELATRFTQQEKIGLKERVLVVANLSYHEDYENLAKVTDNLLHRIQQVGYTRDEAKRRVQDTYEIADTFNKSKYRLQSPVSPVIGNAQRFFINTYRNSSHDNN